MLRTFFWLWPQQLFLTVDRGPHGVLGIEPSSATCKTNILSAILSLHPQISLYLHPFISPLYKESAQTEWLKTVTYMRSNTPANICFFCLCFCSAFCKEDNVLWLFNCQYSSRDKVESNLIFLGLLILENRLKEETKPVLEELISAQIRTVMITGI